MSLIINILENEATEIYFELRASKLNSTLISYNTREQKITLDRSESGALPSNVEGVTRSTYLDSPLKNYTFLWILQVLKFFVMMESVS